MSADVAYLALGELEKLLGQYEEKVKGVEDTWRAYVDSSRALKASWEADLPRIRVRMDQLRNVVEALRREQEVLLAKKELGLVSEQDYESLSGQLQRMVEEYTAKLQQLGERTADLEARILYAWARALTRDYLAKFDLVELERRLEEANAGGKIDQATYARMKRELAIMKASWELLNLLQPE